jgi:hypothetical protein
VICLASAPAARGADSLAPPGAPPHWLPSWNWVLNHWLPYDSETLYAALDTNDQELRAYFGGKQHEVVPTLGELAQQRGWSRARLVRLLVEPWRGQVSRRRFQKLKRRTTLTITQGHLLQHMLFHPLHERPLYRRSEEILGADHQTVAALLRQGLSRIEIGARFGRTEQQVIDATDRVLTETAWRGIRNESTPETQMLRYLELQRRKAPGLLHYKPKPKTGDDEVEAAAATATVAALLCVLLS